MNGKRSQRVIEMTEKMKSLRAHGMSNREIARELGCSYGTVRLRIGAEPKVSALEMLELRKKKLDNVEIAKALKISKHTVLKKIGKTPAELRAKYSKEEMIRLRNEGLGNYEIAKRLGCSHTIIYDHIGVQPQKITKQNRAKSMHTPKWISVKERLPESGVHVFVCCERTGYMGHKTQYVCDGFYAGKYKVKVGWHDDDTASEYSEEDDEFYLEEGWYEVIKNWGDYDSVVIDDRPTHWMPLPEPKENE